MSSVASQSLQSSFDLDGLWPTPKQLLLLKAGLCGPEAAPDAMRQWLDQHDTTEPIDAASLRLIPLVHTNLAGADIEHPLMERFATVSRMTRMKTMGIVREVDPVLEALTQAQVPVLVLKGLHLGSAYYAKPEARPMSDIDIAVPPHCAERADETLSALGYQRDYPDKPFATVRRIHHASSYSCPGKVDIDLHWRIMPLKNEAATDAPFWRDAEPWNLDGANVKVLSPTHLLYHTIIHGVRWNPLPPLRWIADAMIQLRTDKDRIEWDAMVRLARAHRTTHRLARGLRYLQTRFALDAPEEALASLENQRLSLVERIENPLVVYNDDPDETDMKSKYRRLFGEHCRACLGLNPVRFVTDYLDYLILRTDGVQTRREVMSYIVSGLFRRMQREKPREG